MSYLVRVSTAAEEDLHDFDTEEEANDYADWKADDLRKHGHEFFDVRVYEQIG